MKYIVLMLSIVSLYYQNLILAIILLLYSSYLKRNKEDSIILNIGIVLSLFVVASYVVPIVVDFFKSIS